MNKPSSYPANPALKGGDCGRCAFITPGSKGRPRPQLINSCLMLLPMADVFTKKKRSEIMAAVRSTGNKLTETSLSAMFHRNGIKGWRRHLPLPGKPDFTFRQQRVVVFVDGCFWHGCPKHLRMPASNRRYWIRKIKRNQVRDRTVIRELRRLCWHALRLWEHELRDERRVVRRVTDVLKRSVPRLQLRAWTEHEKRNR